MVQGKDDKANTQPPPSAGANKGSIAATEVVISAMVAVAIVVLALSLVSYHSLE